MLKLVILQHYWRKWFRCFAIGLEDIKDHPKQQNYEIYTNTKMLYIGSMTNAVEEDISKLNKNNTHFLKLNAGIRTNLGKTQHHWWWGNLDILTIHLAQFEYY